MMELPLEIDVTTAAERLAAPPAGRPLLLDCRTPEEYATARIAGAVLVPMQEIVARVAELEPHRGRPVIVHCHHGMRSLRVTKWLREQGFSQAQSMAGGIDAWSEQVDPAVPRY
jgi:rhodanese-related sulfurtransferase